MNFIKSCDFNVKSKTMINIERKKIRDAKEREIRRKAHVARFEMQKNTLQVKFEAERKINQTPEEIAKR